MPGCSMQMSKPSPAPGLALTPRSRTCPRAARSAGPPAPRPRRTTRSCARPPIRSSPTGGLKRLTGNLGEGIIKLSAVRPEHHLIEAPARVFSSQKAVIDAFKSGALDGDAVIVLRFHGPQANGMPEVHGLTPALSVMQDRGQAVALVTDGRMSGASGKIPAAIHIAPEAAMGGPARPRRGRRYHPPRCRVRHA